MNRRDFLLGSLAAGALCGCDKLPGRSPALRPTSKDPDIFIFVMDTTRWDHLSLSGYARPTSPFIDEFAVGSAVFTRARATSPWTVSSHASLLTGLFPNRHHATQMNVHLHPFTPYLSSFLKLKGYHTTGIVENPQLAPNRGFSRDFDRYVPTYRGGQLAKDPYASVEVFRDFLRDAPRDAPIFGFVNLIAPHSPYGAPRKFRDAMNSPRLEQEHPNRWGEFYLGQYAPTAEEIALLKLEYDAEILFTDHLVGRLWEEIETLRNPENSIVVITSDHGENFGDHGHMDHVFCLYDSLIHVPMVVNCPFGIEPGISEVAAQLSDVVPTVLGLAGMEYPSDFFDGADLRTLDPLASRAQFSEYYYPRQALRGFTEEERKSAKLAPFLRHIRSVVEDEKKFIWGSEGPRELYDLAEDPEESLNLIEDPDYQEIRKKLETSLFHYAEGSSAPKTVDPSSLAPDDAETLEELRSLGYLR